MYTNTTLPPLSDLYLAIFNASCHQDARRPQDVRRPKNVRRPEMTRGPVTRHGPSPGRPRRRQDVKRRQDGASCDEHRPDDDQRLQDPPTVTKRGYPITDVSTCGCRLCCGSGGPFASPISAKSQDPSAQTQCANSCEVNRSSWSECTSGCTYVSGTVLWSSLQRFGDFWCRETRPRPSRTVCVSAI